MENWKIYFLNSIDPFSIYIKSFHTAISNVYYHTSGLIPNTKLDIVVEAKPSKIIPEIGYSAITPRPGLMRIFIDPNNDKLIKQMGEPLERIVAHELHHTLRWKAIGYGNTLLEVLVSEGLAGRFSQEIYGNDPELWESALPLKYIPKVAELALGEADNEDYDHDAWFFGTGELPRWTGYTLGSIITGELIKDLDGLKPSELIAIPANKFRQCLRSIASSISRH